jgi:hypothetical protein
MGQISNEQLVEKAVITTDQLAAGGKLNPAQADKFIDYVIDVTGLKNNARVVRFRNEEMNIDKIGVGKRVAMPATEAVAPTTRRGLKTTKVTLHPQEIIVPFEISDTFREVNIEGDAVEDHVIRMMATQLANDLESLYIEGDVLGRAVVEGDIVDGGQPNQFIKDSYLALVDGWIKLAHGGHVVDAGGAAIGSSLFSLALNALPAKFKRNRADLRFMGSIDLEQNYREKIATRVTIAGDTALASNQGLTPFGTPFVPFPLFPFMPAQVEHIVLNGTVPTALQHAPIGSGSEVITPSNLGSTPVIPYVNGVDYTIDYAAGTIVRVGAGGITDGGTVKVTYAANPMVLLTHMQNFIVGLSRDIRIEKDRDIFKRVNQYAITCKVAVEFEELDAIALVKNIGTTVS